jgi:hypothetical protein
MAVVPRAEQVVESRSENGVLNLNNFKTKKLFSKVRTLGFGLLSSGVASSVVKSPLTLIDAPQGTIDLKDPVLLLALDIIGQGKGVLYISFNSPREEVLAKMVMALSGVNETMVKKGAFVGEAQAAFEKACSIIYNSNFHVAEGEISSNFWINVHNLKEKKLIDVVLIDDLQSLSFDIAKASENGFQDVLEHFNEMALNVGVPVVLVSRTPIKNV